MSKWIARTLALAAMAAPGTALAHHGGPADIAVGIGAGAVAIAIVAGLLGVRLRRGRGRVQAHLTRPAARPSIRR